MNLVLTINNRRTHTNTVDYLKKCICMYLHTGVKRVCTKMSHRLTITKKKHFPFLQLQVLKKNYVQKKRAWWRDRTLETTLQSHDVLNETGEKKKKKVYTVFLTSICISTQEKKPCASFPQSSVKEISECAHKKTLIFLIVRKTARGLIIINEKQTAEWKYFLLKTHPKDILKN